MPLAKPTSAVEEYIAWHKALNNIHYYDWDNGPADCLRDVMDGMWRGLSANEVSAINNYFKIEEEKKRADALNGRG